MDPAINNHHHLNEHTTNAEAPLSPSMSQSQQPGGQSRQPVSYPSPTSYPSPGLSGAQYSYPAPNNQQGAEPYRASPTGSNGSLNLPSMRSLDPLQQQQQQQQQAQHQQHMGSSLPPPVAQMGAPYYHSNQSMPHPSQYPNVTSDPLGVQNMRYPIAAPDNRIMSGGRHKKEIKRRTKTGCLTCRKRRIKCDEQHPACRNCQKSKRECLGYDPIFKQQPGPSPIQPAPTSQPPQAQQIVTGPNPYGNQPSMLQGYGQPVQTMAYEQALSAGVESPASTNNPYDYASAIDPALDPALEGPQIPIDPNIPDYRGDFKSQGQLQTKPIKIDELLIKYPAPTIEFQRQPEIVSEIKHLWLSLYVPGLDSFLETKFYSSKASPFLLNDTSLLDKFHILLEQFSKTQTADERTLAYSFRLENSIVWWLASLVRKAVEETKQEVREEVKQESQAVPLPDDPTEAAHRLKIYENLISCERAESNPLTKPAPGPGIDHHRMRELEFWFLLGKFVTLPLQDNEASSAKDVDDTLMALRGLLDGRENRDVLYSIAIVRAIGQRVSEYNETDQPLHLDEQDARSKLAVAKRFLRDEGSGTGTSNVIRRLCHIAVLSWDAPRLG